jgi:hypothetical protein
MHQILYGALLLAFIHSKIYFKIKREFRNLFKIFADAASSSLFHVSFKFFKFTLIKLNFNLIRSGEQIANPQS